MEAQRAADPTVVVDLVAKESGRPEVPFTAIAPVV
jgi:hypothetical protein